LRAGFSLAPEGGVTVVNSILSEKILACAAHIDSVNFALLQVLPTSEVSSWLYLGVSQPLHATTQQGSALASVFVRQNLTL